GREDSVKNNADALIFHTAICDVLGMEIKMQKTNNRKKAPMSKVRKTYMGRLIGRCIALVLWVCFIAVIGMCSPRGLFDKSVLLLITIFFYVCDLICVLIWCPFCCIWHWRFLSYGSFVF
ncbi:MAG: hypothetical protein J6J86_00100, partial [Lachnospiraceae bacterium]|nr:hypothetical protein [Lachnospiraceae bacterium]